MRSFCTAAVFASALICLVKSHGRNGSAGCGYSLVSHLENPTVVPVNYQRYESIEIRRQLQGGFIPIETAHAAGNTGPIRVHLVYDTLDAGDLDTSDMSTHRMCGAAWSGETISALSFSTGQFQPHAGCEEQDYAHSGSIRNQILKQRTEWAGNKIAELLSVKPAVGGITLASSVSASFSNLTTTSYPNADLVVIVTARPTPGVSLAGYATCLQRDQLNRCTVGQLNWVPRALDPTGRDSPPIITDERHTALHELSHVLGAVKPDRQFIDGTGALLQDSDVVTIAPALPNDPAAPQDRLVQYIRTPKVLAMAREHFGCSDLPGVPLEDTPLGRGAHWEARVLGPEFMSYGSGSGESFISDLTLALLEDTGHYVANYSAAGRFLPSTAQEEAAIAESFFTADSDPEQVDDPTPPRSPGALRFGRGAGCDFVLGNPREWPSTYLCSSHQEYLCTSDNRMQAVCALQVGVQSEQTYSYNCGAGSSCNPNPDNPTCSGGQCNIPPEQQPFTDDEANRAFSGFTVASISGANTGGFSSSMDYAPVPVGYWSCLDTQALNGTSSRAAEENQGFDFSSLITGQEGNIAQFGGQDRCIDCRCFVSSLVAVSDIARFNPSFPRYGLCYKFNCFRPDYLQIAIRSQRDRSIYWYACPALGGKIYIAGYSGSFTCPPAETFCVQEDATGIKYPETDRLLELYVFIGVTCFAVVMLLICMCPCTRDPIVNCMKHFCGVYTFDPSSDRYHLDDGGEDGVPGERRGRNYSQSKDSVYGHIVRRPIEDHPAAVWVMLIVNTIALAACLALTSFSIYAAFQGTLLSASVPFIAMGLGGVITACFGLFGSRSESEGANCMLLVYFFVLLCILLGGVWVSVDFFVIEQANTEVYVEDNWDVVSDALPNDAYDSTATQAEQIEQASDYIEQYQLAGAIAMFSIGGLFAVAVCAAAVIIHLDTLTASFYTVEAYISVLLGVLGLIAGAFFLYRDFPRVGASGLTMGVLHVLAGILSIRAEALLDTTYMYIAVVAQIAIAGVACFGAYTAFGIGQEAEGDVNEMSDAERAELSEALQDSGATFGDTIAEDELHLAVEYVAYNGAVALVANAMLALVAAVCGILMACFAGTFKEKFKSEFDGFQERLQQRQGRAAATGRGRETAAAHARARQQAQAQAQAKAQAQADEQQRIQQQQMQSMQDARGVHQPSSGPGLHPPISHQHGRSSGSGPVPIAPGQHQPMYGHGYGGGGGSARPGLHASGGAGHGYSRH